MSLKAGSPCSDPTIDTNYLTYPWILALAKGIRERSTDFRFDTFASSFVPLPPIEEQTQIATFLDYADRRIRRYIRSKQKLTKLLEEQKQVVINQAVTRGLDSNVSLKPSGIEWLGDIPAHWEVCPLTRSVIDRADYRGATPEKVDTGVVLVTAKNIRKGWIDYETSREYVRENLYQEIMRRGLPKIGDLLLTMEAPLGNAALVDDEQVALAQRVVRFRMNPLIFRSRFVLLAILSQYVQDQLLSRGTGSTALGIKASKLPQIRLLKPPLEEQDEILAHIDRSIEPIIIASTRARNEISLLREFRTRLIADVVTGKLDVREAAAHLPTELDELEPLEDDLPDPELDSDADSALEATAEDEAA